MTKIALIPAFEPDDHLSPLLEQLKDAGFERIVVDDGSGPEYDRVFSAVPEGTHVLAYDENRGKGYALKTGLEYIEDNFDHDAFIVTMDSDGQHTVEDADRCIALAAERPDTLVLGCRSFRHKVPLRSQMGNLITRGVYRCVSGAKVSDTQTGLRAFSARMIPLLMEIDGDRYEYEMNMLLIVPRKKIPMAEVPIETIYENNNAGSHFRTVKDSWLIYKNIFKDIFKFAGSSFISFLTDYALYSLLVILTAPLGTASIIVSNIMARIVSASVNFSLNRNFVFHDKQNVFKTAIQYFALAAVILAGNTVLLNVMVNDLSLNRYFAKIFTELTFFILSWIAQKLIIFRKEKKSAAELKPDDKMQGALWIN